MVFELAAQPVPEVRRLHPGDWAAVREIRLTALAQAPDAFASTLEREQAFDEGEWRRRLEQTAYFGAWDARPQPGLTGLVATFPEAQAQAQAQPADASDAARTGPVPADTGRTAAPGAGAPQSAWHLVAMWVSPGHRGQGIADRLAAAVCDLARARGGTQVALWVADANPRAQAVYRRLGFRLSGERGILRPGAAGQPDLWEARMTCDL
jgi:ribosomal protein S18 acetylase RimI-like enzyme